VPVPADVGVTAKLSVVLRELSVPPIDRMPFVKPAVIEPAVSLTPSTLNDKPAVVPVVGLVGVGLLSPPPPLQANTKTGNAPTTRARIQPDPTHVDAFNRSEQPDPAI
jgi:hypothetical protein